MKSIINREMKAWDTANLLDFAGSGVVLEKAGPTSGPPRQGMVWRSSTHRWIRPPNPGHLHGRHLARHAKKLAELTRQAKKHVDQASTPQTRSYANKAHRNLQVHRIQVHHEMVRRGSSATKSLDGSALLAGLARLTKEASDMLDQIIDN